MLQLLKIEYAKVKNYNVFWMIVLIYAALVPLGFVGLCEFITGLILAPFNLQMDFYASFPDVWKFVTWTSAWWNFLLGILVVILTCNEISYKTQRQHVIDGMSRREMIFSKFMLIVALAAAVSIYTGIVGFIFGVSVGGFENFGPGLEYIGIYFVQTLGYFSVAYFFAVLIRKSALAIILYLLVWIINLFLPNIISEEAAQFVPTYLISGLNPFPFLDNFMALAQQQNQNVPDVWYMGLNMRLLVGSAYIILFFLVGYIFVKNRDL